MEGAGQVSQWGLAALGVISFAGFLGEAVTGFGVGILFQLGWCAMWLAGLSSGSFTQYVAILTIVSWPIHLAQLALLWRHVNGGMATVLVLASSLSSVVGVPILVQLAAVRLRQVFGATLLVAFLWRVALERDRCKAPPPRAFAAFTRQHFPLALLAGLASGLLGGLFGTPGPPLMALVLVLDIGKDEWRSTAAAGGLLQLPVRLAAVAVSAGAADLRELGRPCMIGLACGFAGLLVGNAAAPRVSERLFRQAILLLLFCGGVTMFLVPVGTAAT